MLVELKRASRCMVALVWVMVLVFAVAPALAMAFATSAGAFSGFVVHAHHHAEAGHVHHGYHHHPHGHMHDDGDVDHDHDDPVAAGQQDDLGQPRTHAHLDVCCPSLLVPIETSAPVHDRLAGRVAVPRVEPLQGAPPDRLLRPPIPSSLL